VALRFLLWYTQSIQLNDYDNLADDAEKRGRESIMSWKICFRGKGDQAKYGLELVQSAAQEYLGYAPTVSDSISLSFEDDLILLICSRLREDRKISQK